MSNYYEITFNAKHLWMILFGSIAVIFFSFLLGLWVGSFHGAPPPTEGPEMVAGAELLDEPDPEPVDLSQAEIPPAFEPEPDPPPTSEPEQPAAASPKPASPKPAAVKPSADPKARWTVQVMAISSGSKAQTWLQKLLSMGYDAYLETLTHPGNKKLYRIRVGRFATREQADAVQRKLARDPVIKKENLKPWVTKI